VQPALGAGVMDDADQDNDDGSCDEKRARTTMTHDHFLSAPETWLLPRDPASFLFEIKATLCRIL
jgi:hypothetical protein